MKMLAWAVMNLAAGRISTKAAGQLIYAVQTVHVPLTPESHPTISTS